MIIISRPLSYVTPDDLEEPLTPAHFLTGKRTMSILDSILSVRIGMTTSKSPLQSWASEWDIWIPFQITFGEGGGGSMFSSCGNLTATVQVITMAQRLLLVTLGGWDI